MSFDLTEAQCLLRDAAQRYFSERHPVSRARQACNAPAAARHELWKELAEQGWPAMLAPDDLGGSALGTLDAWLVAQEAGRHLVGLPLVANMALLPALCTQLDPVPPALRNWLAPLAAGSAWYAMASLRSDGTAFVEGAAAGAPVLACERVEPGVLRLMRCAPLSGSQGLDPTMPVALAPRLDSLEELDVELPPRACDDALSRLRLLRAAEMVGAADAALQAASQYATQRRQFDRPIGANQAVKHRLADDWMALDDARLAARHAAQALDEGAADAERACLAAQLLAVDGARRTVQGAIQVHGAMGITWECDVHLYLKRVLRLAALLEAEITQADALDRLWDIAAV
ncbi:acyl-CoA dehydrogenase family protein [Bordetella genomosp. 13]|uniref:Acyl-CoA dehydrogenase n=1 Tax=Bordetella genomosp. 13 TaxID=463040 RepID=A0A1W6ZC03_9BORD|nr:acyl-CoA dehydrogenase family protein [Bordetella genomosp. 13]ARP94849.1 acyl-CoA dehydrogenase [Bordetella genomosp. 13]